MNERVGSPAGSLSAKLRLAIVTRIISVLSSSSLYLPNGASVMAKKHKAFSPAKAEKFTKAAAKKRTITIALTSDQYATLADQYSRLNPAEAAELIFTVDKQVTSKLKVAGYSYTGDTCCA